MPCERTFRRLLKKVDSEQLKDVLAGWMQAEDPAPLQVVHVDGKVVKNAQPAPARSPAQQAEAASVEPSEIPAELQKPKADKALMLVNFQTTEQRLVDQVAVPRDTNEEAAVAAHLPTDGFGGGLFNRRCRSHHQSQLPPVDPGQRRGVLAVLKGQPAFGAGQSRATAARRPSPLRPARWTKTTDALKRASYGAPRPTPRTIGLAGVAQVVRIHCHTQEVRQGKVIKETDDTRFAVTSYWPEEADPDRLLELGRSHWSIENGQHYRRDRTQDEDRCPVRETTTARNLSLFRSLAIFLFKRQSRGKGGKKTLPDFERHVHRKPWGLIRRFTQRRHEE